MSAPDPEKTWEPPVHKEIDIIARRELAVRALGAIAEVCDMPVTVAQLLEIAGDEEPSDARLGAKRALRAIEAIGRPDLPVIHTIGEKGIYPYVETVIEHGAAEWRFLSLMKDYGLDVEEVAALYELRKLVADYTNGQKHGFPELIGALDSIGIDPHQAALDTDAAASALDQAGYFVSYTEKATYDTPIFAPNRKPVTRLRHHIDSVDTVDPILWVRDQLDSRAIVLEPEESQEE